MTDLPFSPSPPIPSLGLLLAFSLFTLACVVLLFFLQKKLFNSLSARIALLILASGPVAIILLLAYNEITRETLSPEWVRLLQIALIVFGGPIVLGLLAGRFVRKPLRQFNNAVASLEQSNYKIRLQPTDIREFDEVFLKFNDLIERLQHEEKLRKDLVSDTSHELNTPLTAMIGQLTAIQEGKSPVTDERIATLKEQAERLAELVKQLDAYTKARTPNADTPEVILLRQFCEELIKPFNLELTEKGIAVKLDIAADYLVHANRSALQQIFTNLLQNTLRYSAASELTITATSHQLRFSDNGKGVPLKSLPYLFERFYRVEKSRNRTTGGLGLGLAIVSELVEQQGWHIRAEQAHSGVAFVIRLQ